MVEPIWRAIRAEFPALSEWTYLNTATYGQMPRRGNEAIARHLARRDEFACADFMSWFAEADGMRASCAKLIHAQPEDIAFIHNAAAGLSSLMLGFDWRADDEVLTLEGEFPNNLYPSPVPQRSGVVFRRCEWEQFYESITPRTRLVLLSMLNYATGFRPPLEEIQAYLSERGVLLYVDGTQGLGALKLDVRSCPVDMLAVDAYKWMLSPNGAGFAYVSPALRARLQPTQIGWRSDRNWRDPANLNHGLPEFAEAAERFEGGQLVFPSLYAMTAVVDWMLEITPESIEARVLELADWLRSELAAKGAEVSAAGSPIVTALLPGKDPAVLVKSLAEQRILVSARHGRLRVSTHFYNNEADIEKLLDAI